MNKNVRPLFGFIFFSLLAGVMWGENYYVDSSTGDDTKPGTSPDTPWQSIQRINNHVFQPGDTLFMKRGGQWVGFLKPQGSGISGSPVVLTAYGVGQKPLISGGGMEGNGVLSLYNQSFWKVSGLELINPFYEEGDRRGVEIIASDYGVVEHIHLSDLKIHHISGIPGNSMRSKKTAGIYISVQNDNAKPTRYHHIRIENCSIHDVDNQGIVFDHEPFHKNGYPGKGKWDECKFTDVEIRNNVIYHIAKNAMIIRMTEGGIVEHNLCFLTALKGTGNTIFTRNVKGTVFQYNEGFLNKSHDHDGSLYDPDLNSPEVVFRYSYSHDNAHGLLWVCTTPPDSGILVHDNISENDRGTLIYYNYPFKSIEVYRNQFLLSDLYPVTIVRENLRNNHEYYSFTDNKIYNRHLESRFFELETDRFTGNLEKEITNNILEGMPLLNAPVSHAMNDREFPDFTRGYYIDNIGNFDPHTSLTKDNIIGKVNEEPVCRFELEEELIRMGVAKENISDEELNNAWIRMKKWNILLRYMREKNMPEGKDWINIDRILIEENKYRKQLKEAGEHLFFGPVSFMEEDYREYFRTLAIEKLKFKMVGSEITWTEDELKEHLQTGDEYRFDPAWKKRGYEYSRNAVINSFIDQKFEQLINQRMKEAPIHIF